jgi:tRNA nucleotidyltransferase (CCA-adding enzyme)
VRRASAEAWLRELPEATGELVRRVLAVAEVRALRVYLVGGPVRDLLLGRAVRDVDLVVEPRDSVGAPELARDVVDAGARLEVHDRFGTVSLSVGEATLDLATARRESYAHDGALPDVEAGCLADDLQRRDFTVNALALPLSKAARDRERNVVDVAGGLADLRARRLRILHRRSFHDDPTRALRAARLAPRLGFFLTRGSLGALRSALREGAFGRVSGDRLRRELTKLFEDAALGLDPAAALLLLAGWHVLPALEPGLALPREALAPLRRIGRAVSAGPWRAAGWRPWASGLAVWLAPLAPALRRGALRRFSVRGSRASRIAAFPKARDQALRALGRARGRGAIDAALAGLDEDLLHALWACSSPPARRRIARYAEEDRARRPPISGSDLVALDFAGPALGRALARIRVAYLDGRVRTREEALTLASELARRRPRS